MEQLFTFIQEDKAHEDSLGLDAGDCGNEMRFINSYLNVDFAPNVTMRTAYMNTYPRILIGNVDHTVLVFFTQTFEYGEVHLLKIISLKSSILLPYFITVATRDILPGEEFLLDYGEAYTKAFLIPKPKSSDKNIHVDLMESELPGGLVDEDVRALEEIIISINLPAGEELN